VRGLGLILSPGPLWWKHLGFKLGAFLAEALTCFEIYEAHLNKVGFGPMRTFGIEVPLRIWRVFAFTINREHLQQLYFPHGFVASKYLTI
jgi:hypothetical protein